LVGHNKPFRTNATICKAIEKALKSQFPVDWVGKSISIYIEKGVRAFGESHNVPRVRTVAPRVVVDTEVPVDRISSCRSIDELLNVWQSIHKNIQKHPIVLKAKDDKKAELAE